MTIRVLPPDEAKRKAKENVRKWKAARQRKALEERLRPKKEDKTDPKPSEKKNGFADKKPLTEGRVRKRNWASMADEEIIDYAKEVMSRIGSSRLVDIQRNDPALFMVLKKRDLMNKAIIQWELSR